MRGAVRVLGLVVLAIAAAALPSGAAARWSRARSVGAPGPPRAAAPLAAGGFGLWGGAAASWTFSVPAAGGPPRALPTARFATTDRFQHWAANARGDVAMVDVARRTTGTVKVVVREAGGVVAQLDETPGAAADEAQVAIGPDGTAAVVWRLVKGDALTWALRIRPAGGEFRPATISVPRTPILAAVGVAADSRVVAAIRSGHDPATGRRRVYAVEFPPGATAAAGVPLPLDHADALAVITGGPGPDRIAVVDENDAARTFMVTRTGPGAWSAPQRLGPGSGEPSIGTAATPDGGALVAYDQNGMVTVQRARGGGAFGTPAVVGRAPPLWAIGQIAVAAGGSAALVAWDEFPDFEELPDAIPCEDCFDRVRASVAAKGTAFGPAQTLSPLGTVETGPVLAELTSGGRRLVAWGADRTAATAPDRGMFALGRAGRDRAERAARGRLRLRIAVSRAALRAAARTGRLRVGVRCNARCAVRASPFFDTVRAAVVRAGRATVTVRISKGQAASLRRSLALGRRPTVDAIATDAAGRLATARRRP